MLQKAPDATAKPTTTAVDATTKPTAAAATSTPAGAGPTCGTLDPSSTAPPGNAVLYLSVRGPGTITYKCVEANKPVVLEESAELNQSISKVCMDRALACPNSDALMLHYRPVIS